MDRTEKQQQVEAMRQRFAATQSAFLVDFQGLTVSHDTELRHRLRQAEVSYRVVKNRLARLAFQGTSLAELGGQLQGPTAVALCQGDPAAVAKVLVDFAKDHPALKIKAGLLEDGESLDAEAVKVLSKLPALPTLRAKLLSAISGPATQLVSVLGEPGRGLARLLDARRVQLEGKG